jgi:hypothetical protein
MRSFLARGNHNNNGGGGVDGEDVAAATVFKAKMNEQAPLMPVYHISCTLLLRDAMNALEVEVTPPNCSFTTRSRDTLVAVWRANFDSRRWGAFVHARAVDGTSIPTSWISWEDVECAPAVHFVVKLPCQATKTPAAASAVVSGGKRAIDVGDTSVAKHARVATVVPVEATPVAAANGDEEKEVDVLMAEFVAPRGEQESDVRAQIAAECGVHNDASALAAIFSMYTVVNALCGDHTPASLEIVPRRVSATCFVIEGIGFGVVLDRQLARADKAIDASVSVLRSWHWTATAHSLELHFELASKSAPMN